MAEQPDLVRPLAMPIIEGVQRTLRNDDDDDLSVPSVAVVAATVVPWALAFA